MPVLRKSNLLRRLPAFMLSVLPVFVPGVATSGVSQPATAVLGIADVSGLDQGEILSYDASEPTDKTLSAGLAMYVAAPPERLIAAVRNGALLVGDPDVIAAGTLLPANGPEALEGFEFGPSDLEEAEALSEVEPGSAFNFSAAEIEGFRALGLKLANVSEAEKLRLLSRRYREFLWQRLDSYRKNGPDAIAPYVRSTGNIVDVAAELRTFAEQSAELRQYAPELREALLKFPAESSSDAASTLQWVERKVEGRPTVILVHQMVQPTGGGALVAVRDFYVGHSFNSSQMVLGILPYRKGSLVFYSHCTSTDQVAGVGMNLKHAIGRERLRAVMFGRMERFRASVR
ncbi:O-fucosyltransferase family protein [Methylococcus mesophilus]|uniref:hypothetical protein n=1 Tax=Methylococcus mesophilus TaxID=2993564 RepID=UPI00224AC2BE|nr:hypothetical protein [Methylococcus mesophilus]UZR30680.1 hypothetical protein OOT43_08620 [Methylococcus mesophilus]